MTISYIWRNKTWQIKNILSPSRLLIIFFSGCFRQVNTEQFNAFAVAKLDSKLRQRLLRIYLDRSFDFLLVVSVIIIFMFN